MASGDRAVGGDGPGRNHARRHASLGLQAIPQPKRQVGPLLRSVAAARVDPAIDLIRVKSGDVERREELAQRVTVETVQVDRLVPRCGP